MLERSVISKDGGGIGIDVRARATASTVDYLLRTYAIAEVQHRRRMSQTLKRLSGKKASPIIPVDIDIAGEERVYNR